jgi:hypothetical protein
VLRLDDFLECALRVFRAATLRLADLVIVLASWLRSTVVQRGVSLRV